MGPDGVHSFHVSEEDADQRLDHFLRDRFPEHSRSGQRRWIDQGHVLVNQERLKSGYRLRAGDRIEVKPLESEPLVLEPEDIPLNILFEDEKLVVLDKPSGLVVHPGAGNRSGTLANALLHHFRAISRDESLRPGIVHRLDKGTSGLLVIAKNDQIHEFLAAQFKARTVEKEYLALVYGKVMPPEGRIELPLGRHPSHRLKFSTRSRKPRSALTEYRVERDSRAFSFLRIRLHTGRTHQIRVHLEALGHPVVGDELYAGNRWRGIVDSKLRSDIQTMDRLFLHATRLAFTHPGGEQLCFESGLPAELAGLLARLG